jgi:hypothetical protein
MVMRLTAFATNTPHTLIAALELRHRHRASTEDRIRAARATGLRSLPFHDTARNQIWLEIVQIALGLLAWMPMLALTGTARRWEPERLRLLSAARPTRHHLHLLVPTSGTTRPETVEPVAPDATAGSPACPATETGPHEDRGQGRRHVCLICQCDETTFARGKRSRRVPPCCCGLYSRQKTWRAFG